MYAYIPIYIYINSINKAKGITEINLDWGRYSNYPKYPQKYQYVIIFSLDIVLKSITKVLAVEFNKTQSSSL